MIVIHQGTVTVENTVCLQEWDEDEGWEDIAILPGDYAFRVLDFFGWHPCQLEIDGVWVDVAGTPIVDTIREVLA